MAQKPVKIGLRDGAAVARHPVDRAGKREKQLVCAFGVHPVAVGMQRAAEGQTAIEQGIRALQPPVERCRAAGCRMLHGAGKSLKRVLAEQVMRYEICHSRSILSSSENSPVISSLYNIFRLRERGQSSGFAGFSLFFSVLP